MTSVRLEPAAPRSDDIFVKLGIRLDIGNYSKRQIKWAKLFLLKQER